MTYVYAQALLLVVAALIAVASVVRAKVAPWQAALPVIILVMVTSISLGITGIAGGRDARVLLEHVYGDPTSRVAHEDPVVRARAAHLWRSVSGGVLAADARLGILLDPITDENIRHVRDRQRLVLQQYLERSAIDSPADAKAMAGLAAELGLEVPEDWRQYAYDPVAVASAEARSAARHLE